jgi:hypothetical protein
MLGLCRCLFSQSQLSPKSSVSSESSAVKSLGVSDFEFALH